MRKSTSFSQMAEDLFLAPDELGVFIDLWENYRCLWDPTDIKFKNKHARQAALTSIADALGRGWTAEDVRRKIESLKSYYRKLRRKKWTGSAAKRKWSYFEKIHGLLGCQAYGTSTMRGSEYLTSTQDCDAVDIGDATGDATSSPSMDCDRPGVSELDLLSQVHAAGTNSPSGSRSHCNDIGNEDSPTRFKRKEVHGKTPRPDFQDVMIDFIQTLKDARKERNENMNYAITVADRLTKVRSTKRLTTLKHKIDSLIYETLLEEMPDD